MVFLYLTGLVYGNKIMFVSKDQRVWFEVELFKNDLQVSSNKFKKRQIFFKSGDNVYQNRLGARIYVLDDEKIQYDDPNHHLKFNLYREASYESFNRNSQNQRSYKTPVNTQQLEGTWYTKELNRKLALLSTREGFKIKFSGTTDWVEYVYDKVNDQFTDANGNFYEFTSLTTAQWVSKDKNRFVIIEKTSDVVDY